MLIGISIALIIAATFAAVIFSLSQRNFSFSSIARDEKGLSTLEWILLVAAVGGLATAGVIIVRNAVGGAGDQVDDTSRTERLAQRDVNIALRTRDTGSREGGGSQAREDARIHNSEARARCSFDRQYDDGTYPLRKWRGSFTLKFVEETTNPASPTAAQMGGSGGSGTDVHHGTPSKNWCDAVPTNNLLNNPANFAEPIRVNYSNTGVCVRWPDHDNWGTDGGGVRGPSNDACSM